MDCRSSATASPRGLGELRTQAGSIVRCPLFFLTQDMARDSSLLKLCKKKSGSIIPHLSCAVLDSFLTRILSTASASSLLAGLKRDLVFDMAVLASSTHKGMSSDIRVSIFIVVLDACSSRLRRLLISDTISGPHSLAR